MEQKKKHNRNIYIVLAVVLCLAGVFFVKDAVRAVEEMAYPRTYAALVQQYAAEYGVDENKVYAIIRTESGFKPEAESKVGARGLMQITDETFLWIKSKIAPGEEITFASAHICLRPALHAMTGIFPLRRRRTTAAWGLWTVCCRRRNILRMEKLLRHSPMSR